MGIEDLGKDDRLLTVRWADGTSDDFHYIWLRDHIPDHTMFDPDTGERCTDFHEISLDIRPVEAHVDGKGDLRVTWPDVAATVCYPARWLRNHAYSPEARNVREGVLPAPKPWPFRSMEDAPVFDYDTLMQRPELELECLRAFRAYGMAFIRSAPAAAGVVETLTTRLGYLREVAFGRVRNVRVDPTRDSVTFTSRAVKPHIDASNYIWPIEVQFLHCIANDAVGADSWIVDGAAVAEQLKQEDPAAYHTLARVKVSYRVGADALDVRHTAPVIELDQEGNLRFVRFSNAQRRILSVAHNDVEPFYAAYHRLSEIINDPANQIRFRFRPGDALMFNNHRILHARSAFDPESGVRHLQLASTDLDMVDSRIRLLLRDLKDVAEIEALLP